ncbi:F-box/LRR-repeat protein 15-like isoform X2 [Papaver somniferum]|uniref:F-box/LRR-repeat protein 15-like isoform X2 n=1 Tax=Papaver somniferum TaxID=3469 RepID=UPI000E6FD056|nr:F-box/LRR-repeat protein 15-like isoform X2 [Papaver somniferum]
MRFCCCFGFNSKSVGEKMSNSERDSDNNSDSESEEEEEEEESDYEQQLARERSVERQWIWDLEDRARRERDLVSAGALESMGYRISGGPRSYDRFAASSSASSSSGGGGGNRGSIDVDNSAERERVDIERYSHFKRAKVNSSTLECRYAVGDASTSAAGAHGSLAYPSQSNYFYMNVISENVGARNLVDSENGENDGDEPTVEEFLVRMDLTDDLLHMVFSFLDHTNLCRAAGVCRQWRSASGHEDFWKRLNFEDRNITEPQFADMCRRYPKAIEVNLYGTPSINSLALTAMASLRKLETLILGKGQLGDAFFQSLDNCISLRTLSINDAALGNGVQEIPVNNEKLRHLQIIKCRVLRISVRCPQLETLSLKRTNMAHGMLNCPQLQELDIGSCHKLSDAGIRAAVTSCPLLTSLDMSNCSCVSDETLREIAQACANLHVLNASYCPNISLESVRMPMLTVLKLVNCEGITSASMTAIAFSSLLEVLELDNCGLLTAVSLYLPHLHTIRLVHCRKFADLSLRTPLLSSITISNCAALHRINITSNSLQKLVLQKQESLKTLVLKCNCLQEVDLTDCEALTNSICEGFSDEGGCPVLKSLILDNCESLTAVKFSSTSLVSLSLVGCRGMTSLELKCRYLEQVHLDGCDHLEQATFCPVGLRSLNLGICPKLEALDIAAPLMVLLELKGCGVLSEASIRCPRLITLDASFCGQLKDDCLSATTAACPLIQTMILMSCQTIGPDGLSSLRLLSHLTFLDLSYTFLLNLQPVFLSCLQLKVLKLQACKYLEDYSLEALYKGGALPSLRELDLSYGSICQSAIEELLSCCTHLTHVSLNGCNNMHDLNWGSSCGGPVSELSSTNFPSSMENEQPSEEPDRLLQNLNCVGCSNIKKVVIPEIARCFHLSSLNLSLSANLKEVDVACFNLSFLNLSNCCSLEILKLKCPRLTSLFLQSCSISEEAVESAVSHCNMLETLDVRFCPKIHPERMMQIRLVCPSLKRIFSSLPAPP